MAVTYFQREVWSKKIQDALEMKCKLIKNCTREYEGEVEYAKTVRILGVGDPMTSGYQGRVDYEDMEDLAQWLPIDFAEYFSFRVDDIDKAQSMPGLPQKYQKKAVDRLAQRRDINIGRLIAGKCISTIEEGKATYTKTSDEDIKPCKDYFIEKMVGEKKIYQRVAKPKKDDKANYYEITSGTYKKGADNITTASDNTQTGIKEAIDNAMVNLRLRNYDGSGVIEIDPRTYKTFKNNLIELSTNNPELIRRGVVGMYDDFEVVMTNALYHDEEHIWCMARSKEAIAFAGQINKVESMRLENSFADGIRGLDTYGMSIIAQDELEAIKVPVTTP